MHKEAKKKTRRIGQTIATLTEGVFSHIVDILLWSAIYTAELSVPQSTSASGQVWRAQVAADRFLHRVNYDVIKDALKHARRRGWIQKGTKRGAPPAITAQGRRRLTEILPHYDPTRTWDGRMHLITYDIPEKRRQDRDLLRMYLRRLGCGKLQDSVWMTPYNPIDIIRSFIEEQRLGGTVIISDLGAGGSIGEEDLVSLVVRIYPLETLDDRYSEWFDEAQERGVDHWMVMGYLAILRDDPQLPFPLLPAWWKGDKAYALIKPYLDKV